MSHANVHLACEALVRYLTEARTNGLTGRNVRRMWSLDLLPMPKAFFVGPRWRRHFGVTEKPIAEISPAAARLHRPGRKLLIFTFEEDVRELVGKGWNEPEEIRPGVFAEW